MAPPFSLLCGAKTVVPPALRSLSDNALSRHVSVRLRLPDDACRGGGGHLVLAATREAEGVAEETERPGSSRQTSVLLSAPRASSQLVSTHSPASSIDRIEQQAKSSIDKLKHLLYKLKTRPPVAESAVVRTASDDPAHVATSSTVVTEEQREVYISQKLEVDLSMPQEAAEPSPAAPAKHSEDAILKDDSLLQKGAGSEYGRTVTETLTQLDSVTCTRTTVQFDEENHTAVVTVTATVRGTDVLSDSSYTERTIAMAARALARTCLALDEKAQLAALVAGPMADIILSRGQQQQHDSTLRHLALGEIVSFQRLEGTLLSPFRPVYSVVLRCKEGQEMAATFRPIVAGDKHGRWQRAPADWVAYQMAILLGVDVVPPVAIRNAVQLGDAYFPSGVMVFKVQDARPLSTVAPESWGEFSPEAVVSNAHILDALIGAAPRRQDRFHFGRHWASHGESRPVLLDFPMGAGLGELHSAWSKRGQLSGVKHAAPVTLSRLRGLSQSILLENLSGALTADEMATVLERRDQIIAYFDAMTSRHGRHLVFK